MHNQGTVSLQENKVLFVVDAITNPHAGTEGQLLMLIDGLKQSGFDVHLLLLSGSRWVDDNPLNCSVTTLGLNSIKNPMTWVALWNIARKYKKQGIHLVQTFFNDASVIVPPVFKLLGFKTIVSRRDMGFWYTKSYRLVLPVTGKFVDRVVANSRAVGEITCEVERIDVSKTSVIYNGYEPIDSAHDGIIQLEALKSKNARIIGIVANIRPIKRIEDAVEAVAILSKDIPDLHLVIVGDGDVSKLNALSISKGVSSHVTFLGSRSDVKECLSYFEAGIICSESEGFSNAIVEYQLASLPVICTDAGGNPEAIERNVTGWLYPVGDKVGLSNCLIELLANKEKSEKMGKKGREIALAKYTGEVMVNNYVKLYQELLENE